MSYFFTIINEYCDDNYSLSICIKIACKNHLY